MKCSIRLKLIAGFSAALPLMAIMGVVSFYSISSLVDASANADHTYQVIDGLERMVSRLKDAETGQRGFIITGEDRYLEPFSTGIAGVERELRDVRALTYDNSFQQKKLDIIEPLIQLRMEKLTEAIKLRREVGLESALGKISQWDSGKHVMDALLSQAAAMEAEERRLLEDRADKTASTGATAKMTIVAGSYLSIILFGIIAFFLSRSISTPLSRLEAAVWDIGQGDLTTRVQVNSNDEIGGLGTSFNRMAEGLQQAVSTFEISNLELKQEVSERRQAEEEARSLAATLEVSNRDLQDFASVASHDLQEPLRKILAFGDRLNSRYGDTLGEQGKDYLHRMMDASQRMRDLIDDLLTLSRVTSQGNPNVPVDLAAVAEQVLADLEVAIEKSGGRLEVGDLPTIEADPTQMRQLLQNLISNALKFQKPGEPPFVKIKSQLFEDYLEDDTGSAHAEKMLELTVEDTGIGFDESYGDRIFKVFQRLHGRNEYAGTGLGLAVCRKIVERHNGTITAKSKPDQGAKFIVTLPLRLPEGATA